MTIKDNPIDPILIDCNEECCLFRWNKCITKNKDGTCDKPNRYDQGDEFYPSQLAGGKSLIRSWSATEIAKQLLSEEELETEKKKNKNLMGIKSGEDGDTKQETSKADK